MYPAPFIQEDSQLTKSCNLWSQHCIARYLELKDGLRSAMRANSNAAPCSHRNTQTTAKKLRAGKHFSELKGSVDSAEKSRKRLIRSRFSLIKLDDMWQEKLSVFRKLWRKTEISTRPRAVSAAFAKS